jgi:hypothetical protein
MILKRHLYRLFKTTPSVAVLVTENAWVQITAADGTVIYENIMLPGEEFVLPQLEIPPKLRAGMSGYVYFSVNGELFGPVGSGTSVRKNVELSAANITSTLQTPELSNKKLIAELISKEIFQVYKSLNWTKRLFIVHKTLAIKCQKSGIKMSENHIRPWRNIYRRKSRQINVGNVPIGGDAPIAVQTMTNTLTTDIKSTIQQVVAASEAGADLVRVSVPDIESSKALKEIVKESPVPIVADIHFHYKRGIEAAEAGAACLRINPGNIGSEERVKEVIRAAKDNNCSMRIGVNAGSLEKNLLEKYAEPCPEAMVESGLDHIKILEDNDFHEFKISVKASDVFLSAAAYQALADATDAPLHLGNY